MIVKTGWIGVELGSAGGGLKPRAPDALRARIDALIRAEARPQPRALRARAGRLAPWAVSGTFAAIAASLALVMVSPQAETIGLENELVAGHVRSLLAAYLTDIATSNRHVVSPGSTARSTSRPRWSTWPTAASHWPADGSTICTAAWSRPWSIGAAST